MRKASAHGTQKTSSTSSSTSTAAMNSEHAAIVVVGSNKPSSAGTKVATPSSQQGRPSSKNVSSKAINQLAEQAQKNPIIAKAKQKVTEATDKVEKLAMETVILEEELKKLRSNMMKDREERQQLP